MSEWINHVLNGGYAPPAILAAVFLLGMISVVTCACNFAVIGVVAGYSGASASSGKTRTSVIRGVTFLSGGVFSMALIGLLFGYAGQWISNSLGNWGRIAAALIAIFFGLYSMDFLPFRLPGIKIKPGTEDKGIIPAILFGLSVGGLFSALNSCCNPLFPVVLAATFVKGSAIWGLMILAAFALGYCIPIAAMMIGLSLGFGKVSRTLSAAGSVIRYAGGAALLILGFYMLFTL